MSTATAPPQGPPRGGAPPPGMPPEPPRRGVAKRFLIGGAIVVALTTVVVVVATLNELGGLQGALTQNAPITVSPGTLAPTAPGAAQTLLLVGDDRRPQTRNSGVVLPHSNEMLLVRFDPSKPYISMLSIPRDLQVTINPHNGTPTVKRFNVAYTIGGIQLMTETIKRVLGVSVNHVVVITFPRFKRAVDEMGCVFSTIDRRYLHSNAGLPAAATYTEVNLQPGYQQVCGRHALEFVGYRHGDTALIRDARDQRFLLDVKKQFGATLFARRGKFERIFGRAVQTDLHGKAQIFDLVQLLATSAQKPVRQVHFASTIGPIFVTATPAQIHANVNNFLHGPSKPPKRQVAAAARSLHRRLGGRHHGHHAAQLALTPTTAAELRRARRAARHLPFALEYPRARDQSGAFPDYLRVYGIRDPQGHNHAAYVAVIDRGRIGENYDIQGTGWTNPPLLANPDQTINVGPRTYQLYYQGEKLHIVAWHDGPAVYWVINTLTDSLPPREMLAIAEETLPLSVRARGPGLKRAGLGAFGLPARAVAKPASTLQTLGGLAAILGLVAMALLARQLWHGRRDLEQLRVAVATALQIEARRRATAYAAGVVPPGAAAPRPSERRPRGRARAATLIGVALALAAVAVFLGVRLLGGGSEHTTASAAPAQAGRAAHGRHGHAARVPSVPTVPVAVFNATSTAGAAHNVAQTLQTHGVQIAAVSNLATAPSSPGMRVLYAPGQQAQAASLARLLAADGPTVGPLDAVTRAAAGSAAQLVVVVG